MKTKGIGNPPKETAMKPTPLGDVLVDIQAGKCLSCEERPASLEEWGVLKVSALTWGEFRPWENKVLPIGFDVPTDLEVRSGDLLISRSNTTELVGAIALVGETRSRLMLSDKTLRLVPKRDVVSPEYLEYALRTPACREFIEQNATGASSSMKNITQSTIRSIPLLLPPLADQRRIAARLKEELAELARARAAVEAQLKAAQLLPAALLRSVFQSRRCQQWLSRPLDEVCELLPSKSISTAGDMEVQAVTSACLTETGFNPAGIKTARMSSLDANQCVIRPDEILIARSNTPELVGRAAIYSGERPGVVASDLTIRLWCGQKVNPRFLSVYLSFLFIQGYWKEVAGGASGTMKKITRKQIANLPLPLPELDTQIQIENEVSQSLAESASLVATLAERREYINRLPGALLTSAFSASN